MAARVVRYDAFSPITSGLRLLEITTQRMEAHANKPLRGVSLESLGHRVRFRATPVIDDEEVWLVQVQVSYTVFEEDSVVAEVNASLMAVYDAQHVDAEGSELEDRQVCAEVNGIHNAWPYVRELVTSCAGRLGLAGAVVPLWRPGEQLAGVGEWMELSRGPIPAGHEE